MKSTEHIHNKEIKKIADGIINFAEESKSFTGKEAGIIDHMIDDASSEAMDKFLFSPNPDIISGLLDNALTLDGNMNYIFKFIYMARQIPEYLGIHKHPSFVRLLNS